MMNEDFLFAIGEDVELKNSDESGIVIGRAEFETSENQYLVRYMAGDGRQVENWWGESALRR
jgi:hypothetical protein